MDYGLLNAIGMTAMALFGLWAIGASMRRHCVKNDGDKRDGRESSEE